ncbi:SH3 domain-containing protein [Paeniglutamicibacter antarcticus]|uniref:SH3b domain-containing protein n=1 Tax=Paeniglutamicibacter antarcticus TaxID=494023 RepID=A0ABP9TIA7_9MICC
MKHKNLGVVLSLAVALIGGPATVATAQPIEPVVTAEPAPLLATADPIASVAKAKAKVKVSTAKPKVYHYAQVFTTVKSKASASSVSVLSIQRQSKVEVLGRSGSWSKVVVSGKSGFVPSSALGVKSPATVYRWVKGSQPVYQVAKTSSKKLGTVSNNSRVTWLRTSGAWQAVRTSVGTGWVQSRGLSTVVIKAPAKPKVYHYAQVFTTVKSKASASSVSVLSIQRQSKVEVLGRSGSWSKVVVSGKSGFVPSSALGVKSPATVYRWVKGSQPVYQVAKTSSKKLGTVSNNSRVTWLRTSGAWQAVRTSVGTGWVQSRGLSTVLIKAPPKPPVAFNSPRWTTANVNLRSGPGTKHSALGVVTKGERILLGPTSNGWSNVKTSKGTGWISSSYLTTTDPKPVIKPTGPKPPIVKPTPPQLDSIVFDAPRWPTANLNLRSGPATSHKSIGVVPMGERVLRGESSGGWAHIKTSKGTGWVSEIYLATSAPTAPVVTQHRWATGDVNVRAGNSTVYPVMGLVKAGDRVTYLHSSNGWAKVVTNFGTGWMSELYLSKIETGKLQPDTIAVNAAVKERYGTFVYGYGGIRAGSVGHSSGRATDLMIRDYKSVKGIKNGDDVARLLIANRESLGIYYLIWQDKIWLGPAKGWEEYSKSGKYGSQFANNWNDTTRHMDHIHAETHGNSGTGVPLVK